MLQLTTSLCSIVTRQETSNMLRKITHLCFRFINCHIITIHKYNSFVVFSQRSLKYDYIFGGILMYFFSIWLLLNNKSNSYNTVTNQTHRNKYTIMTAMASNRWILVCCVSLLITHYFLLELIWSIISYLKYIGSISVHIVYLHRTRSGRKSPHTNRVAFTHLEILDKVQ